MFSNGDQGDVPGETLDLWHRVVICQAFPAYRLEDLDGVSAWRILQAVELLGIYRSTRASMRE